jgi:hypothetical protein
MIKILYKVFTIKINIRYKKNIITNNIIVKVFIKYFTITINNL